MGAVQNGNQLIGRARAEAQDFFRSWYDRLGEAAAKREPTAYVLVMGSFAEILRSFDLHLVFPEINSLQAAVRRASMDLLNVAEDYGYSPDICSYVKADVGVHLRGGEHPLGRIPPPSLVVATNMCNTYIKWAEIWQRLYGAPMHVMDLPGRRGRDLVLSPDGSRFRADAHYVAGQLRELIETCERITGRKLDLDRLRHAMDCTNRMSAAWREIVELNKNRPALFNVMSDGLAFQGMVNAARGTEEGARFMEHLREELQERLRLGMPALPGERYRLLFVGTWCYTAFRRFIEMFEHWGGIFVQSEYLAFGGGGLDRGIAFDVERPLESLAEQYLFTAQRRMSTMFFSHDEMGEVARDWFCDGVVYHAVKSCRTVSTVLPDSRENMIRKWQIPSLLLESDLVDPRCWSEAQMKNRIDAFFESLDVHRGRRAQAVQG